MSGQCDEIIVLSIKATAKVAEGDAGSLSRKLGDFALNTEFSGVSRRVLWKFFSALFLAFFVLAEHAIAAEGSGEASAQQSVSTAPEPAPVGASLVSDDTNASDSERTLINEKNNEGSLLLLGDKNGRFYNGKSP